MNIIPLMQALFCIVPAIIVFKRYGLLNSISESWYKFVDDGQSWMFGLFTMGVSIPMIFGYNTFIKSDEANVLFILCGMFLFGVWLAPTYKDERVNKLHYAMAALCIVSGMLGVIVEYHIWWHLITFVVIAVGLKLFKVKYITLLIEYAAIALILYKPLTS